MHGLSIFRLVINHFIEILNSINVLVNAYLSTIELTKNVCTLEYCGNLPLLLLHSSPPAVDELNIFVPSRLRLPNISHPQSILFKRIERQHTTIPV